MPRLEVPESLNRNSARAAQEGAERTGARLIELATAKQGVADLSTSDVLDLGCGVRFAQTIVNRQIPIGSYVGVDVYRPLIEFLQGAVTDPSLSFLHWDVHNAMYNPEGAIRLSPDTKLPISREFDAIWAFSVFTHMDPGDSAALFSILRRHVRPGGVLFFTAFLRPSVERFEDKDPENPLLRAAYGERYLRELVTGGGWDVVSVDPPDPERLVQHQFLCRPRPGTAPRR